MFNFGRGNQFCIQWMLVAFVVGWLLALLAALVPGLPGVFTHNAWRAFSVSVEQLGTTKLGLFVALLSSLFPFIRVVSRHGWAAVKRQWVQLIRDGLAVTAVPFLLLTACNLVFLPPETFSTTEIREFAYGVVVALAPDEGGEDFFIKPDAWKGVRTGFRVDGGLVLTCVPSAELGVGNRSVGVGMMYPPRLEEGKNRISGELMTIRGQLVADNSETGV